MGIGINLMLFFAPISSAFYLCDLSQLLILFIPLFIFVRRILELTVPAKEGRAWKMSRGDLCKVSLPAGPQVGDLNFWNESNTRERFFSGKTRQLHAAHLTVGDRLWSCLPFLNPMATIVADSIAYGVDDDGAGVHDVIGTR